MNIRINKRIKDLGLASRREADALIERGLVLVNGKIATLGESVTEDDVIEIKQDKFYQKKYIAFYKPRGVVSHSPQYGEKEIKDFFPDFKKDGLVIIGRLDKHSEGLMLLTNDKRLVERILDPRYDHEKEYIVNVQEKLSSNIERLFAKGFQVRGRFHAKPAQVEILDPYTFSITLTEGKKHQIRLMTNELHYTVSNLLRVRVMNIKLGNLKPGKSRELKQQEIKKLLSSSGLH
jgi:23S rRNA pseudouridine2604 synthase